MTHAVSALPIALTIEVAFSAAGCDRPQRFMLDQAQASRLGESMAADLTAFIGPLDAHGLIIPGGLFDLPEILRPGLPVTELLKELYQRGLPDTGFQPRLVTLGLAEEAFPIAALLPQAGQDAGPLLIIPAVFVCQADKAPALSETLEALLLDRGQASTRTRDCLDGFGIAPVNLHYATLHDLSALLRIQLDNSDLVELRQLIEQAIWRPGESLRIETPSGDRYELDQGTCYASFPVFSRWRHNLNDPALPLDAVLQRWARWHLRQRQIVSGLQAHGVTVQIRPQWNGDRHQEPVAAVEPGGAVIDALPADATAVTEWVAVAAGAEEGEKAQLLLTEQRLRGPGCVAYTAVLSNDTGDICWQCNMYPLSREALLEIPARWRAWCEQRQVTLIQTVSEPPALNADGTQLAGLYPDVER